MARKDKDKTPVLKIHKTSEDRSGLVDRLIDSGHEVVQNKAGIAIMFGDGQTITFKLQTNAIGAQGFGEILNQAKTAVELFRNLVAVLEAPTNLDTPTDKIAVDKACSEND